MAHARIVKPLRKERGLEEEKNRDSIRPMSGLTRRQKGPKAGKKERETSRRFIHILTQKKKSRGKKRRGGGKGGRSLKGGPKG